MQTNIELPPHERAGKIASFDPADNTVDLSWTSGSSVRRRNPWTHEEYDEILDLRPASVRLGRLNGGAPLLQSHRADSLSGIIGTVVPGSAYLAAGHGFAKVKLSARKDVAGLVIDIADGIIRNVSVGYRVHKFERTPARDGQVAQWRAIDWEPLEISAVAISADTGAQFRSEPSAEERARFAPCTIITRDNPSADASATFEEARNMTTNTLDRPVRVGLEDREKRGAAIENAILHRVFPKAFPITDVGREFRGMSLLEMAKDSLSAQGIQVRGLSKMELAVTALDQSTYMRSAGEMSTGDFPNILANVLNKSLRKGYQYAGQTFRPLVRETTVPDFKTVTRVLLGEAPALEKVLENGEYRRGGMGDSGESYAVATYGKIIGITRQTLINDDLEAFTRIPRALGLQAAQLESDLVWSQILSNPVLLQDGITLFNASHNNMPSYGGSGIQTASISAGRTAMARQTGRDGLTTLSIDPAYLIVPKTLQTAAEQFLQRIFPTQMSQAAPESLQRLQIISEARLDNGINRPGFPTVAGSLTAWYLAADPEMIDLIELAYLEGTEGVYTETRMGFDVDDLEVKIRMDVGAKAIDYRGLYMNPGA